MLLWFSLAGDADGGDGFGDTDADGPLAFLSLSTMSFVLGFFGLTGLLLDIVDNDKNARGPSASASPNPSPPSASPAKENHSSNGMPTAAQKR
ncbi:MAG: hypothetical protein EBY52_10435 [Actinobacteria bacterium]|nr:hypothetical protein [Actinomycetota bacterium]